MLCYLGIGRNWETATKCIINPFRGNANGYSPFVERWYIGWHKENKYISTRLLLCLFVDNYAFNSGHFVACSLSSCTQ